MAQFRPTEQHNSNWHEVLLLSEKLLRLILLSKAPTRCLAFTFAGYNAVIKQHFFRPFTRRALRAAGPSHQSSDASGAQPQEPATRHDVKQQLQDCDSATGASVHTPASCTQSGAETQTPAPTPTPAPTAAAPTNPTATCPPTRTDTSSATLLDSTAPTTSLSSSCNSSRRSASDGGGSGGTAGMGTVRDGDAAVAAAVLLHLSRMQSGASDCASVPTGPSSAEWDETAGPGKCSGASSRVAARAVAGAAVAAAAGPVVAQQGVAPVVSRVLGYQAMTSAVMVSAKVGLLNCTEFACEELGIMEPAGGLHALRPPGSLYSSFYLCMHRLPYRSCDDDTGDSEF